MRAILFSKQIIRIARGEKDMKKYTRVLAVLLTLILVVSLMSGCSVAQKLLPSADQKETPTEAPAETPTEAPAETPKAPAETPAETPDGGAERPDVTEADAIALIVGDWYATDGIIDEEEAEFNEGDVPMVIRDDGTGTYTYEGTDYDFTYQFEEVDEDGDYGFEMDLDGEYGYFYYQPAGDDILFGASLEFILLFMRDGEAPDAPVPNSDDSKDDSADSTVTEEDALALVVGEWQGVYAQIEGEYTDLTDADVPMVINADGTGKMTAGDATLEFTFVFEEVDEDGDYGFEVDIEGDYGYFYYVVEDDDIVFGVSTDLIILFEHA